MAVVVVKCCFFITTVFQLYNFSQLSFYMWHFTKICQFLHKILSCNHFLMTIMGSNSSIQNHVLLIFCKWILIRSVDYFNKYWAETISWQKTKAFTPLKPDRNWSKSVKSFKRYLMETICNRQSRAATLLQIDGNRWLMIPSESLSISFYAWNLIKINPFLRKIFSGNLRYGRTDWRTDG